MKLNPDSTKELCLALIRADTEAEVIHLLDGAGLWKEPDLWRWLGNEEYNYSSVGNQQSRAEQALVEKLVNSIDAKLIAAARLAGYLPKVGHAPQAPETPKTILDARNRFYSRDLSDMESLSRSISVVATGAKPREGNGRPSFTIIDDGEGQTPGSMPNTILSLHKGYKDKIKFVQGKFNMGGTGVLEFCGMDRNLQLVISKRHPGLLPDENVNPADGNWSFTVVRREDPTEGKSSRFTYLAPIGADQHPRGGELLHFATPELPLFPDKNRPYVRMTGWGTLVKLYEYDAHRFATGMMFSDGLMYRARLLLPEPALPIRFHECRSYRGHTGSYDTAMLGLIETLRRDLDDRKRENVEWHDRLEFNVDGEPYTAHIYLFKNKDAADTYRRDEGVVFTYNGQSHATMTKDFFRRKRVKQDYLWHSLFMFVDCSAISTRAHERLFMNGRDRLRHAEPAAKLEAELEDQLGRHEELRELASERRKHELAEQPRASESMAKVIENLLSRNPTLAALLGQGIRIKNPHKPESASDGAAGFIGKMFPTQFHFKGHEPGYRLIRDAHLNAHARIAFETDASNDYFKRDNDPGQFELYRLIDGHRQPATNYQRPRLFNGIASMSLNLPADAQSGDDLAYEALVTDPSQIEAFRNEFVLKVKLERTDAPGGSPTRSGHSNTNGSDRGPHGKSGDENKTSHLDIPNPIQVYERDWANHDPPFDKFTSIRVKRQPDAPETDERYDYYLNMDNIHLQTYLKAKPKLALGMKLRFSVGMTLVALAVLHQEQLRQKDQRPSEDMPDGRVDVRDRVAHTTSAIAPFLLPMIEGVSELTDDDEYSSESAGEVA